MDEIDSLLMGDERDDLDEDGVEDNANEEERPMKQQNHNQEDGGGNNFLIDDLGGVGP